jgi:hypothetical protein
MGWGELPGSPGGSPRQVPGPLVALRVHCRSRGACWKGAADDCPAVGQGLLGAVSSASGTNDDCHEEMTVVRADVRGARTPPYAHRRASHGQSPDEIPPPSTFRTMR